MCPKCILLSRTKGKNLFNYFNRSKKCFLTSCVSVLNEIYTFLHHFFYIFSKLR